MNNSIRDGETDTNNIYDTWLTEVHLQCDVARDVPGFPNYLFTHIKLFDKDYSL